MPNVTVNIQIQFDVHSSNSDLIREEVLNTLDQINITLSQQYKDKYPIILTNSIDNSDIDISGMCQKYPNSVSLPDEDGNCGLCGGNCV